MSMNKHAKLPSLDRQLANLLDLDRPFKFQRTEQIETVLAQFPNSEALIAALLRQLALYPVDVSSIQAALGRNESLLQSIEANLGSEQRDEGLLFDMTDFVIRKGQEAGDRLHRLGADGCELVFRLRCGPKEGGAWKGYVHVDFSAGGSQHWGSQAKMPFTTSDLPSLLLGMACMVSGTASILKYEADKSPKAKPTPLFKYHPERFRSSRAYAKNLDPVTRLHNGSPAITQSHLEATHGALMKEVQQRHMEFTIEQREEFGDFAMKTISSESNLLYRYLTYKGAGKEIFDFPLKLADMLANSDADDLRLDQIRVPYATQYVHFGPRVELELARGWLCDGAYVAASDDHMTVVITAAPKDPAEMDLWPVREEPAFTFHFEPAERSIDLGTAVDMAVARLLANLSDEAAGTAKRQAELNDVTDEMGLPEGSVWVSTAERAESQRRDAMSRKDVAHKALSLVVNALCYLTAYPDDIDHQWPSEAPAKLIVDVESGGTPGARKRAAQQLSSEGFTMVRLCGAKFRQDEAQLATLVGPGGSIRTHWRRGHWRNQMHGAGRQLRRLVWIMPVLVNASGVTADSDLPGHIYKPELPENTATS